MFNFVLLLADHNQRSKNEFLRAQLLLKSMSMAAGEVFTINILTPKNLGAYARENLPIHDNLKYVFIADEEICPEINKYSVDSWYKQQYLKIAVARHIDAKFYMLLDCDLVAINKFSLSSFIKDGKALTQWQPANCHYSWHEHSARALQLQCAKPGEMTLGVTPNIFSQKIALNLLNYIETKMHCHPAEYLLEKCKIGGGDQAGANTRSIIALALMTGQFGMIMCLMIPPGPPCFFRPIPFG